MTPVHLIDGEGALSEFRAHRFSVGTLAPIIDTNCATLVNLPVGIGKSTLLDDLLDHYLGRGTYDLVIMLAAMTANLLERRLVHLPVSGVLRLRPRPHEDCGPLDPIWRDHESQGTTTWAKRNLCPSCVHHGACFWPKQYGSGLRHARVIFGTHQHLVVNRRFLQHLRLVTCASKILLLIDEADFLEESFRIKLSHRDLRPSSQQ